MTEQVWHNHKLRTVEELQDIRSKWLHSPVILLRCNYILNGYGKGLLAKQLASLIYKMSFQKTEEPISLEWKMELNENATSLPSHPLTIAPNCSKSQTDTVICRTSTRIKKPPITRQNFMVNDISSIEYSNI